MFALRCKKCFKKECGETSMFNKLICAALLALIAVTPALGGLLSSNTYPYTNFTGTTQALLTVNVYDNFNGDTSRWLWTYDVQNLTFDPLQPNGSSAGGIKLFNPGEQLIYSPLPDQYYYLAYLVDNITPGYIQGCCSDFSGYWNIGGILAGQSFVFQFTTPPSTIITKRGTLAGIDDFINGLTGSSNVPGPIPEPGTILLAGVGLCLLVWGRARQHRWPRQTPVC
jgi:PEP-CTERM motif